MGESWSDLIAHGVPVRERLRAHRARPRSQSARTSPATPSGASATTTIDDRPLNYSDLGLRPDRPGGPRRRRDLDRGEHRHPPGDERQVRRRSRLRRRAAAELRRRADAGGRVPGQPAVDPARVRLVPAAGVRGTSACSTRGTPCSRPTWSGSAARTRTSSGTRSPQRGFGEFASTAGGERLAGRPELRVAVRERGDRHVPRRRTSAACRSPARSCSSATTRPASCRWPTPTRRPR